ncbi:MAG: pseudouridine synthase [Lachnospiraceae bacterium]|nr:pseudouridine synthase [Lachnospiraceae bacterium]
MSDSIGDSIRLNKYLSSAGFCSRRKADEWIAAGKVKVNGVPADMGMRVTDKDVVTVNGKVIRKESPFKLVAFYKPTGYACTSHRGDQSSIFLNFELDSDLKYIGRLDKDSEGLLLLTNDGDLCNEVSKARNQHEKEYVVTVNKPITDDFLEGMSQGVRIYNADKDSYVVTKPCKVYPQNDTTFTIILTQGLNRQIRRMCEHFGYRVKRLRRIRVMNITLDNMKSGEIRKVSEEEYAQLKCMIQDDKKSN